MAIGSSVWSTPVSDVGAGDRRDPGNMYQKEYEEHIAAKRTKETYAVEENQILQSGRRAASPSTFSSGGLHVARCLRQRQKTSRDLFVQRGVFNHGNPFRSSSLRNRCGLNRQAV